MISSIGTEITGLMILTNGRSTSHQLKRTDELVSKSERNELILVASKFYVNLSKLKEFVWVFSPRAAFFLCKVCEVYIFEAFKSITYILD